MLRLNEVELCNFGPFRGRQTIIFPPDDGVTVIYGENMRGKTTLLNALRFALFGRVLGRNRRQGSLATLPNIEEAVTGNYEFSVTLRFDNDGQHYELTRTGHPRAGHVPPASDADIVVDVFLTRDGDVLGPGQRDAELQRIMPEQISRFFLFDAELLQEYEELLSSESDMGNRISKAIESVLGVPVLTDARAGLAGARTEFERREARAAGADKMSEQLGVALAGKIEERDQLESDLQRTRSELEAQRAERSSLEEAMRKEQRLLSLLERRDLLEEQRATLDAAIRSKTQQITERMGGAWRSVVRAKATSALEELRDEERRLERRQIQRDTVEDLGSTGASECPACLQPIEPEARERLRGVVEASKDQAEAERSRLAEVRAMTAALDRLTRGDPGEGLRMLWADLRNFEQERFVIVEEIAELNTSLGAVQEKDLRDLKIQSDAALQQMTILEAGIQTMTQRLDTVRDDIARLRQRVEAQGGITSAKERAMVNHADLLYRFFDKGVAIYRERLREHVESDATELFRRLTTEPQFVGLRINESYGLRIVHEDGSIVPVRSAGAEHVVALCLMGALQRNAPLRGPIVIDSAFGRLDSKHTENIVRALPTMAPEVVLLVYEDELRPALARSFLGASLRAEYSLARVSARHTNLEKVE